MKIYIIFHSLYGHVHKMAEAIAEGAREVEGAEVSIFQVEETLPDEVLEKMGAIDTRKAFAHIPVIEKAMLREADAIIFGAPTRYGNVTSQMRAFIERLGSLWMENALVGKVGSVFTSSGTQHGGQESTLLTFHVSLLHFGMVIVGMPYSEKQMTMDEITGGSPYGVSTIAGGDNSRQPSDNELSMARFQGKHVAGIAKKLAGE